MGDEHQSGLPCATFLLDRADGDTVVAECGGHCPEHPGAVGHVEADVKPGLEVGLVVVAAGGGHQAAPFIERSRAEERALALLNCEVPVELAGRFLGPMVERGRGGFVLLSAMSSVAGAALSEHTGAREDAGVVRRDGRLQGRALFPVDFEADVYVVADQDGGLSLVAADAPGLTRTRLTTIDITRPTGELRFDAVAAEPLEGASPELVRGLIDAGRVLYAADTLGAAQEMLDQAVAYAGERKQFGRPIGSFQAVKHMCAEMAAALEPCRALVWYAAYALDTLPAEASLTACHAKAHLAEVGTQVARTATEVHGGMGFTDLVGLHYWFKRIGFNRQMLGGPQRVREEAARFVLA